MQPLTDAIRGSLPREPGATDHPYERLRQSLVLEAEAQYLSFRDPAASVGYTIRYRVRLDSDRMVGQERLWGGLQRSDLRGGNR